MYSQNPNFQGSNPAASPPLHHPVPQHPIPPFRSPPPAEQAHTSYSHQQGFGANPSIYTSQPGSQAQQHQQPGQAQNAGQGFGNYGNFLNDPSTQIGIEVGRNAFNYGQEYLGRNLNQIVSVSALKYYFQVSNSYVVRKIGLVLFPWLHKPWSRIMQRSEVSGAMDGFSTARDDINAPDMYIPVMACTTYVLLFSVFAGLHGTFHPEILGYIASKVAAFMIVEIILLKLGTYLLSAGSKMLDFVAYSGYKFIGITVTMLVSSVFPGNSTLKWAVFTYSATSNSFFLLRSLRYILLPDNSTSGAQTINSGQRQRRIQFLFFYAFVCQFALMWLLM